MTDTNTKASSSSKIESWRMAEEKPALYSGSPIEQLKLVLGEEATAKLREVAFQPTSSPKDRLVATSELASILGSRLDKQDGVNDGVIVRESLVRMLQETVQAVGADPKLMERVERNIPAGDLTTRDFENQIMGSAIRVLQKTVELERFYAAKQKPVGSKKLEPIETVTPEAPTFRNIPNQGASVERQ